MNLELLQQENLLLKAQVESFEKLVASLQEALKWTEAKYAALEKKVYGSSSERVTQEDLRQFLPGINVQGEVYSEPKSQKITIDRKKQSLEKAAPLRGEIPAHIERRRIEIPAPEAVLNNPHAWEKIGEQVTERIGIDPANVFCEQLVIGKYKSREERNLLVQSPVPPTLGDKCLATPEVGVHVVLQKFDLHLPYYRQRKHWKETYGVWIHESTFESWGNLTLDLLVPLAERVKLQVLASKYLQIDETPIDVLDPEVKGTTATGQFFVYSVPGKELFFDWQMSRGHQSVKETLQNFLGSVQSDGYSVYETISNLRPDLNYLACWAHVRRKFIMAFDQKDPQAAWFVEKIGKLYEIESRLREVKASLEERKSLRQNEAIPILDEIKVRLDQLHPTVLLKSHIGKAVAYAHKLWKKLIVYVTDGIYEIDNNGVENAIRPSAIGKKNYLFVGAPGVGQRHAAIYTLIGSCRRLAINPHEYIPAVVKELCGLKVKGLQELDRLTPREWLKYQAIPVA